MQLDRSRRMGVVTAAVLISAAGAMAGAPVPTFIGLGDLPEGSYESNPSAVSDDGAVVTGYSYGSSGRKEIFRWTQATGILSLGDPPSAAVEDQNSAGISADGSVIFGSYTYSGTYDEFGVDVPYTASSGYFWTEATGYTAVLNSPNVRGECYFMCATADGQTFFGAHTPVYPGLPIGSKWTASNGWETITSTPPAEDTDGDGYITAITACNPDGSVLAGTYYDPDQSNSKRNRAFRWTASDGIVLLDSYLTTRYPRDAFSMSDDGLVIVGAGNIDTAYRWEMGVGTAALGDLPGGTTQNVALSVTADGSTVVGYSGSSAGDEAFIWDEDNGMRNLQTVLVSMGTATVGTWTRLPGYRLNFSPDGRFLTGLGRNPSSSSEAFLVDFGVIVPPCLADFNNVNGVTVQDIFDFLTAWLAGSPTADFNTVNGVTVQDIFDFLTAWLAGC